MNTARKNTKLNDLSQSSFRRKFLNKEFLPETNFAVAMGRVSTKEQKEEGSSDEAQMERIQDYALEEDLKIVREWDVAETASKHESRKHFKEMLQLVRTSQSTRTPIKHILFSHQSRSNRN